MSKLCIIDGKIEALRQHIVAPVGVSFTFIRFNKSDREDFIFKNVGVATDIYSYLRPGLSGRFCYFKFGMGAGLSFGNDIGWGVNILCGIRTADKTVIETSLGLWMFILRLMGFMWVLLGIVLSIVIIGIPLVLIGLSMLFGSAPSQAEIRSALEANP